jgi:hypothetical protein
MIVLKKELDDSKSQLVIAEYTAKCKLDEEVRIFLSITGTTLQISTFNSDSDTSSTFERNIRRERQA